MKLQSYVSGDWQASSYEGVALRDASTGEVIAHASSGGLDFAAVLRDLGIADDAAHVNAQGGAIALGHPLGASGARLVTTALCQLERGGGRRALATMCIGVGQGIAMVIERTQ